MCGFWSKKVVLEIYVRHIPDYMKMVFTTVASQLHCLLTYTDSCAHSTSTTMKAFTVTQKPEREEISL